jgi:pyrroline-5-carboxylate reductase
LSIAAGLDLRFFKKILGDLKIVRLMPNTPALVGLGATAFFAGGRCTASDRRMVRMIFESVGQVFEVPSEKLLDAVTALSGSGPAFVYLFLKSLIDGGTKLGLAPSLARSLAIQTLLGATTLFARSPDSPATLISRVASKGGTTEAGLQVLALKKFETIVDQCLGAAAKRAETLRKQLHSTP